MIHLRKVLCLIQSITSEESITIAAGESTELAVKCRTENFVGVRAIIASYVSADGVKHENPSADEWVKTHELGKITELD